MLFFLTWLLGGLELCTVYKSDWFLSLQLFWHISLHIRVLALLMLKQGHCQEFDEGLGKVKGSQWVMVGQSMACCSWKEATAASLEERWEAVAGMRKVSAALGEGCLMGAVAVGGGPPLLPTQGPAGKEPRPNFPTSFSSWPWVLCQQWPLSKADGNQRAKKPNW